MVRFSTESQQSEVIVVSLQVSSRAVKLPAAL